MSFLRGDIGEELWCNYLRGLGHTPITAPKRKFYDWDVKVIAAEREVTFEIKYDSKAYWWAARRKTPEEPNLYIEFKNTNKDEDSGIRASKAHYYIYILKRDDTNTAYIFERVGLLDHLERVNYKVVGNAANGDNNARGWIPPLSQLVSQKFFLQKISL